MLSVLAELQRELMSPTPATAWLPLGPEGARGRRPKLNADQALLAQQLYDGGDRTVRQIADIFSVPRSTIYGHLDKASVGARPRGVNSTAGP